MENEKRKTENEERNRAREEFSAFHYPFFVGKICPACGSEAKRENAKFCLVCGKLLGEGFQPLDTLRASYRLQGKSLSFEEARKIKKAEDIKNENLFEENKNFASDAAKACVVYSLVPYLGILFCPLALLSGGVGVFTAYRKPYLGGARTSIYSIVFGIVILAVQILLWWLLYIIPELGRKF